MLLIGFNKAAASEYSKDLTALSINQLEAKLAEMEDEREQLARLSLRSGSGSIGYRSKGHLSPESEEWVEVELSAVYQIDQIVLAPSLWRSEHKGFQADAFPEKFRIIAGTLDTYPEGQVVAEYDNKTAPELGIAPLVLPIKPATMASWVRMETSTLGLRKFDENYILQLSELLIFSGNKNVALKQPVNYRSQINDHQKVAWDATYLTDGFMPYIMDAGHGNNSVAYVTHSETNPIVSIDLGKSYPISQIHLHTMEQSDTVPQPYNINLGIPLHLKIEGANQADFSDAISLIDEPDICSKPNGPILMWNLKPTPCRYIRIFDGIHAVKRDKVNRLGFAEIEIFADGKNVALSAPVTANFTPKIPYRKLEALTDGNNLYGAILPVRLWLEELSRRQQLEYEIPKVQTELTNRYVHQKAQLRRMSWLIAGLIVAVILFFLISHNLQLREFHRLKKRIAADLHDELGANIHTIGLLSDAAKTAQDSPEQWDMLHTRIRRITESTGRAIEHSTNMLESSDMHVELLEGFHTTSRRFSSRVTYELTVSGESYLKKIKPQVSMDLLLFYKECLVNITRHSQASAMTAELIGARNRTTLIVTDNGTGIEDLQDSATPTSLKRRADLMNAQLKYENLPEGGTRITLIYKSKKLGCI